MGPASMRAFAESLSLQSGAAFVAAASAIAAVVWARLQSKLSWIACLSIPLVVASTLYWSPVLFGAPSSEYATWAPVFIVPWYAAGAAASAAVLLVIRRSRR
jgi:hypothetical protein